jgi:hypothetical protein
MIMLKSRRMEQIKLPPILLPFFIGACWGLPFLFFGVYNTWSRASIEVNGKIIKSETQCEQPYNNRCVTTYTLKSLETGKLSYYQAGPNDPSLRSFLPVNTILQKEKRKLSYKINGQEMNDFSLFFYLMCTAIGTSLATGGFTVFVIMACSTFQQPVSKKNIPIQLVKQ